MSAQTETEPSYRPVYVPPKELSPIMTKGHVAGYDLAWMVMHEGASPDQVVALLTPPTSIQRDDQKLAYLAGVAEGLNTFACGVQG